MMDENKGFGFLLGFLLGGIVGASVALLLAPQSGTETREYIRDKAMVAKGKAEEMATEMGEKFTAFGKDVKKGADEMIAKGKEATDKISTAVKEKFKKTEVLEQEKEEEIIPVEA